MVTQVRRFRCPFCGLQIVANDATRSLAHAVPECERFTALVAEHGGSDGTEVVLDPTTRERVK